jgi:hypothetical protein
MPGLVSSPSLPPYRQNRPTTTTLSLFALNSPLQSFGKLNEHSPGWFKQRIWDKAALDASIALTGYSQAYPLIHKLETGQPITVIAIGTSISADLGGCYHKSLDYIRSQVQVCDRGEHGKCLEHSSPRTCVCTHIATVFCFTGTILQVLPHSYSMPTARCGQESSDFRPLWLNLVMSQLAEAYPAQEAATLINVAVPATDFKAFVRYVRHIHAMREACLCRVTLGPHGMHA